MSEMFPRLLGIFSEILIRIICRCADLGMSQIKPCRSRNDIGVSVSISLSLII